MKTYFATLALFLWSVSIAPQTAHALKQYRCGTVIQYRPCEMEFPGAQIEREIPEARWRRPHRSIPKTIEELNNQAEVEEVSFKEISADRGKWSGTVHGKGPVEMTLIILQNGNIVETRSMGKAHSESGSTTFAFVSALPQLPEWDWKIFASSCF